MSARGGVQIGRQCLCQPRRLVGDSDPSEEEFSIQMRPMDAESRGPDFGIPALVALCGGLLRRNIRGRRSSSARSNLARAQSWPRSRLFRMRCALLNSRSTSRRKPSSCRSPHADSQRFPLDENQHQVLQGWCRRRIQGAHGIGTQQPAVTSPLFG